MVKHGFNKRWRERDRVYEKLSVAVQRELLHRIEQVVQRTPPKPKGRGRPSKLTDAQAVFLAAVREHHHQMPYRELASSEYLKRLGVRIHYTNLRKSIERAPRWLLREAIRTLAELVAPNPEECVMDAKSFSLDTYGERCVGTKPREARKNVKLSAIWDAETNVFYGGVVLEGDTHEGHTLPDLVGSLSTKPRRAIADAAFASRRNVQYLVDLDIEASIRPPKQAISKARGSFAWRRLVKEFRELGYERWKRRTGYGRRFEEEHALAALVNRFGNWIRAKCERIAEVLVQARVLVHNFFQVLLHRQLR